MLGRGKILIPDALLLRVLSGGPKDRNRLSVYLFFQLYTNSIFKLTPALKALGARETGLSIRTFNSYLRELIDRNWIGYNPITRTLFLRSRKVVSEQMGQLSFSGYGFDYKPLKETCEFPLQQIHLIAFCNELERLGKRLRYNKRRRQKEKEDKQLLSSVDSNKVTTLQDGRALPLLENFTPWTQMSISLIAKHLKLSPETVRRYKSECTELGWIDVRKDILILTNEESSIRGRVSTANETDHGIAYTIYTEIGLISQCADVISVMKRNRKWNKRKRRWSVRIIHKSQRL